MRVEGGHLDPPPRVFPPYLGGEEAPGEPWDGHRGSATARWAPHEDEIPHPLGRGETPPAEVKPLFRSPGSRPPWERPRPPEPVLGLPSRDLQERLSPPPPGARTLPAGSKAHQHSCEPWPGPPRAQVRVPCAGELGDVVPHCLLDQYPCAPFPSRSRRDLHECPQGPGEGCAPRPCSPGWTEAPSAARQMRPGLRLGRAQSRRGRGAWRPRPASRRGPSPAGQGGAGLRVPGD